MISTNKTINAVRQKVSVFVLDKLGSKLENKWIDTKSWGDGYVLPLLRKNGSSCRWKIGYKKTEHNMQPKLLTSMKFRGIQESFN